MSFTTQRRQSWVYAGDYFDRWYEELPWRRSVPLGRRGEEIAARHLRRCGYRILERNFRAAGAEIDLVARIARRSYSSRSRPAAAKHSALLPKPSMSAKPRGSVAPQESICGVFTRPSARRVSISSR
jgi:hypothetical protein